MIEKDCADEGSFFLKVGIMLQHHSESVLYAAAAYNILSGLALLIVILLQKWESFGPYIGYSNPGPAFLSLFACGAVIIFGVGYLQSARRRADSRTFLLYGGILKYWVFFASIYVFFFDPLFRHSALTTFVLLILAGSINLVFAILFTGLLRMYRRCSPSIEGCSIDIKNLR